MRNAVSILLYVRPWNRAQMEHLARGVWGDAARLFAASEHKSVDSAGLTLASKAAYLWAQSDVRPQYLTMEEAEDIILRCRLLRSLSKAKAQRLLVAMEYAVDKVLSDVQPDAMLSLTVDSYVMDVFAHLCKQRGIPFIGLVPSFLKNQFRITTRGEHVPCREVSPAEIEQALSSLIVQDYRPDFLVQSEHEMRSQMRKLWLRNLPKPLWFYLRRSLTGERLNYHFWTSQMMAIRYWSPWPRSYKGLSGPALADLAEDGGLPLVYLPLQMAPEATIDYWSDDIRWIDYESFLLNLVRRYRGQWRFLVKEHPNLVGYRSRGFYKRLEAEPNCVLVAPKVPSNDLVNLCQGVLVCTGTSGFEAALRGKPVMSDSAPYYAPPDVLLPIAALDGDLPKAKTDPERQAALMEHVLRCTLPGRFLNNGTWSAKNPEHLAWSATMANSIRDYLKYSAADHELP